jgi:hypothetical protein
VTTAPAVRGSADDIPRHERTRLQRVALTPSDLVAEHPQPAAGGRLDPFLRAIADALLHGPLLVRRHREQRLDRPRARPAQPEPARPPRGEPSVRPARQHRRRRSQVPERRHGRQAKVRRERRNRELHVVDDRVDEPELRRRRAGTRPEPASPASGGPPAAAAAKPRIRETSVPRPRSEVCASLRTRARLPCRTGRARRYSPGPPRPSPKGAPQHGSVQQGRRHQAAEPGAGRPRLRADRRRQPRAVRGDLQGPRGATTTTRSKAPELAAAKGVRPRAGRRP